MLYILTFQVLSMFSAPFLVLSRFHTFLVGGGGGGGKFQAIFRPGQTKFKSPGFPGFQVLLGTLFIPIGPAKPYSDLLHPPIHQSVMAYTGQMSFDKPVMADTIIRDINMHLIVGLVFFHPVHLSHRPSAFRRLLPPPVIHPRT